MGGRLLFRNPIDVFCRRWATRVCFESVHEITKADKKIEESMEKRAKKNENRSVSISDFGAAFEIAHHPLP
jgi:hypothetical protein